MEQWLRDGRKYIRERGRSYVPLSAESEGFTEDLSGMGLRGLLKKKLSDGAHEFKHLSTPLPYATCYVGYQYIHNGEVIDEQPSSNPMEVVVGAGYVTQGFDEALLSMFRGEKSIFWLDQEFAFRENGLVGSNASLPSNTPVQLMIELINFENPVSPEEKLKRATLLKDEGNALLNSGKNEEAVTKYKLALNTVNGPFAPVPHQRGSVKLHNSTPVKPNESCDGEQEAAPQPQTEAQLNAKRDELRAILHTNLAVCYFQAHDNERCLTSCSTALMYNPKYAKALARRALLYRRSGQFSLAMETLNQMLVDRIGDPLEIQRLIEGTLHEKNRENLDEVARYKQMFGERIM